ncbi:MAG TPA: GNAT family N-acetyltransferase [Thermomicrobiales bacterium]|nr:GNAT family N-acetyltransferase [Thermomicrobiales bacterium]
MTPDLDLMQIHVSALYRHDDRNRLLAVNEPGPPRPDDPPPPRLYLGRTRDGLIWRFRHDLADSLVTELEPMLAAEPVAADLSRPPRCLAALQSTLAQHSPLMGPWSGPAWLFPAVIPASEREIIPITEANDDLVRPVFPILAADIPWCQPCLAVVEDGRLASLCYSARNTPIAAEAGVDTLEEFRGRGYAPAVVAVWARAVRQEERIPLYSTSWDNLASRSVARKLGLVLYGADYSIE